MTTFDFGTIRLYDGGGFIETSIPKYATTIKEIVKKYKGRWDPNRKRWNVTPKYSRSTIEDIVEEIRLKLMEESPRQWKEALPQLKTACTTTRRFSIVLREGGARLRIPPGYKHEYTLNEKRKDGVEKDGMEWIIPSCFCADKIIKNIFADILKDDRKTLANMIDYLEGYTIEGTLNLIEKEYQEIGINIENIIFANNAFLTKTGTNHQKEDIEEYPMKIIALKKNDESTYIKMAFLTKTEAWNILRVRNAQEEDKKSKTLDMKHTNTKWIRKKDLYS